jgi:hypothetical protein
VCRHTSENIIRALITRWLIRQFRSPPRAIARKQNLLVSLLRSLEHRLNEGINPEIPRPQLIIAKRTSPTIVESSRSPVRYEVGL